jgi:hypothetical protein
LTSSCAPVSSISHSCVDKASDVFIADLQNSRVVEHGHGDETPKATLSDPGYYPNDCSVDPRMGNLAVTNLNPTTGSGEGNVLIYVNASGTPRVLIDPRVYYYFYCSYDNKGDLYIDGSAASLGISRFDELPVGHGGFKTIGIRFLMFMRLTRRPDASSRMRRCTSQ